VEMNDLIYPSINPYLDKNSTFNSMLK
jgi:hypothetical protein